MDRSAFITAFVIVLIPLLLFAYFPSDVRRCSYIGWDSTLYVLNTGSNYAVLTEEEFVDSGQSLEQFLDLGGVLIRQRPSVVYGPWKGSIELYIETSYLPNAQSLFYNSLADLSPAKKQAIFEAVVARAKQIPEFAIEQPGEPPVRMYVTSWVIGCILKAGAICLGAATIAWLLAGGLSIITTSTAIRRLQQGKCVHCGYDSQDLPSPICPECGHNHAQAQSA